MTRFAGLPPSRDADRQNGVMAAAPSHPFDVPTPYLAVDADRLSHNVQAMARFATSVGAALRPHAKTHKSLRIAELQREHGAVGLTVATISEAEIFVRDGFDDLFIAFPLWVDAAREKRFAALLEGCRLRVGVDSADALRRLAAFRGLGELSVAVEVDSGHHRSGVQPEAAGELAARAAELGLAVAGVFTFPGHSYSPQVTDLAAADEAGALADAAGALAAAGVPCGTRSGGSTPSVAANRDGVTNEVRPGVYVFNDAQQWELGVAAPDQIALTVVATVVSHAGGRLVLDAGSKALGADRAGWASGYGRLLDHPEARIEQLSEHHAVVHLEGALPPIGSRVRVVPNHVCAAVNLSREYLVMQGEAIVDVWPVDAAGANT